MNRHLLNGAMRRTCRMAYAFAVTLPLITLMACTDSGVLGYGEETPTPVSEGEMPTTLAEAVELFGDSASIQARHEVTGLSVLSYRDFEGNEIDIPNPKVRSRTYETERIEIDVIDKGWDLPPGQRAITHVVPSVTIYTVGSNCVTVCKGKKRPVCEEICID
jgi:hypothetical protein